jgi:phenylacetate-CoA ligase
MTTMSKESRVRISGDLDRVAPAALPNPISIPTGPRKTASCITALRLHRATAWLRPAGIHDRSLRRRADIVRGLQLIIPLFAGAFVMTLQPQHADAVNRAFWILVVSSITLHGGTSGRLVWWCLVAGTRESLLGPSYFHHRRLIQQSKHWSPGEIREYQEKRYRRLIRRYGDAIRQKEDYRRHLDLYTRWDLPLLARTVRTGGTLGQPLRFRADTFARRQKERAYLFDIWSRAGYQPYDLRVSYRGDICGGLVRYNALENVCLISPGAAVERELGRLRDWVRTLPPFFLHVYPSSLFTFIDLIGEDLFRQLPVRGVLAGSEVFPWPQQVRFEEEFGLPVAHWYGHSEYAVLARYCRECRGFHFYPTYGCMELLPSEAEGCQRIVTSSFNRIGTQFVRYDTGDLATAAVRDCTADHFPRVDAIVGRSQETFIDNAGRKRALGPYIFGIHGSFWDHVRDLQFVLSGPGLLKVRVVPHPGADKNQIERTFERRFPMAKLEFEYVRFIERSRGGKRRYTVDALDEDPDGLH